MARGDPTYFRVDIDILNGERFGQLTANERDTFLFGFWGMAVKVRSDHLPASIYLQDSGKVTVKQRESNGKLPGKMLAHYLRKDWRTVMQHVGVLHELGLIEIQADGSVYVPHVKELHPKLNWDRDGRDCPIRGKQPDPYGEAGG